MSSRSTQRPVSSSDMFTSLRSGNFRIFLAGQLISNIGGWTQRIAQDWLVLTLTGSATAVGVTTALQFLPTIALGPIGGLIADRYPKRRILLITNSVMATCAGTLGLLTMEHRVTVLQIYALATILGIAVAVDNPTRQSFANDLVGPLLLRNAISLNSAVFQLGALIGPAISGVLIGAIGIGSAFLVNCGSFLAALLALSVLRPADLVITRRAPAQRGQVRAAARYLMAHPEMRYPTILAGIFSFFTMSLPVTMASFSSRVFHAGSSGFALLTSLMAAGSVVGSLLAARHGTFRLRGLVALAAALAGAQIGASSIPGLLPLGIALIGLGLCVVLFGITANATVQLAAGDHIRGRVLGLYLMVVMGAGCLGGPAVGAIDEWFGPRGGLLLGGLIPGAVTVVVGLRLARTAGIRPIPALRAGLATRTHRFRGADRAAGPERPPRSGWRRRVWP
ncbi:MFS transporter [Nakamurella panacisegetis]|uniref:MFS transporter n=1 Tax=Nakamurella panacisegetis TaxID=1090615 RepID=UPI0012FE351A|nr:MFS transporter [Nakamurella panacisegetis]